MSAAPEVLILTPAADARPGRSRHRSLLRRIAASRPLVLGLIIFGTIAVVALLAPLIAPDNPLTTHPLHIFGPPSGAHLLGTDDLGRDILSRLLFATRSDLVVGVLAVLFPFVLGTLLGLVSGYYGGILDTVVMRIVDAVIAFPFYVLVVALVFRVGMGTAVVYIAFALTDWVAYARLVRAQTVVARELEWVAAARTGGLGDARILVRHVLPNVVTQAVVYAMSDIVFVILAVVTLGFLGLGIQPPTPDLGGMVSEGQIFLSTTHWALSTIPGLVVVAIGLGLSLIGDGLADVLRPL